MKVGSGHDTLRGNHEIVEDLCATIDTACHRLAIGADTLHRFGTAPVRAR